MASQLATQGYRIAKSWQYQENLPDPTLATQGEATCGENNNSFFVSSSLNHPVQLAKDEPRKKKKFWGLFPCKNQGTREDPNLQRPLILGHKQHDSKISG